MRRLAAATVMLTAVAVGAQAGGLPKAVRLVDRMKPYNVTHYVRGLEGGGGSGRVSYSEEARQDAGAKDAPRAVEKQKPVKPVKAAQKPESGPQRADD